MPGGLPCKRGWQAARILSLIPEIPFKWGSVFEKVIERSTRGNRFSIVCVAEGAKAADENVVVKETDIKRTDPLRFGGIGEHVSQRITS